MPNCNIKTSFYKSKLHCFKSLHEWNRELGVLCLGGGVLGVHLWPTIPTRGTHNTPSLHHPQTSQSPTTSVTKPHPSPMTVVLPQPPTVVRAERPAPSPSVRLKQPTLPRTAPNSSNTSNKRFATNGRHRPLLPTPRPQQPLLPTPHNMPTSYPRSPANPTSRVA